MKIQGGEFEDENFKLKHTGPGIVYCVLLLLTPLCLTIHNFDFLW